ncbi:hypothetical protein [Acidicapsa acidisoli]|uniref:hypothetical protein n=1 Tax=Acidicapsa acidisoli TaxID=1615681 RepID=UPI0021DF546E|nr:hypothetical protein [Acidicapsa acidisoli]
MTIYDYDGEFAIWHNHGQPLSVFAEGFFALVVIDGINLAGYRLRVWLCESYLKLVIANKAGSEGPVGGESYAGASG